MPEPASVDPLVVGREVELRGLRTAFERARGGRRQLCFVTGEPGIGKSTLVRTFLAGLEPSSLIVARGACFEQYSAPEPYLRSSRRSRRGAFGARRTGADSARSARPTVRHAASAPRQRRPAQRRCRDVRPSATRRGSCGSSARRSRRCARRIRWSSCSKICSGPTSPRSILLSCWASARAREVARGRHLAARGDPATRPPAEPRDALARRTLRRAQASGPAHRHRRGAELHRSAVPRARVAGAAHGADCDESPVARRCTWCRCSTSSPARDAGRARWNVEPDRLDRRGPVRTAPPA